MEATTTTKPKAAPKKAAAPKATAAPKASTQPKAASNGKIAIILIRGMLHTRHDIVTALDKLLLRQRLACVVIEDNRVNRYTAMKVKDYTTFGTITEETYKALVEKRGEKDADGKVKKYFRLHPPRGGFERRGIKIPFSMGGVLGDRKEKMNELIMKML